MVYFVWFSFLLFHISHKHQNYKVNQEICRVTNTQEKYSIFEIFLLKENDRKSCKGTHSWIEDNFGSPSPSVTTFSQVSRDRNETS